jgi:hypothetical protein
MQPLRQGKFAIDKHSLEDITQIEFLTRLWVTGMSIL